MSKHTAASTQPIRILQHYKPHLQSSVGDYYPSSRDFCRVEILSNLISTLVSGGGTTLRSYKGSQYLGRMFLWWKRGFCYFVTVQHDLSKSQVGKDSDALALSEEQAQKKKKKNKAPAACGGIPDVF